MATEIIRKIKADEVLDDVLGASQRAINDRLTTDSGTSTATMLTDYTGDNYYTFPADGIVYLRNDAGNNGSVQIRFSNANPTMLMGKAEGYFLLPVRAGWRTRVVGTPYLAYYFPFSY